MSSYTVSAAYTSLFQRKNKMSLWIEHATSYFRVLYVQYVTVNIIDLLYLLLSPLTMLLPTSCAHSFLSLCFDSWPVIKMHTMLCTHKKKKLYISCWNTFAATYIGTVPLFLTLVWCSGLWNPFSMYTKRKMIQLIIFSTWDSLACFLWRTCKITYFNWVHPPMWTRGWYMFVCF